MREFHGDWRDVFLGFGIALDLRKLALGFVGMAASILGVFVLFVLLSAFIDDDFRKAVFSWETAEPEKAVEVANEMVKERVGAARAEVQRIRNAWTNLRAGKPDSAVSLGRALRAASDAQLLGVFGALSLLWCWLVWAYFAGAMSRIAAGISMPAASRSAAVWLFW